jgi:hypothetical protein
MSLNNKNIKEEDNKEKEEKVNSNNGLFKSNKYQYSYLYDNKMNIITMENINNLLKIIACIKENDNENDKSNYYSKYFNLSELTHISNIFKLYNDIENIQQFINKIFINKPIIIIEENSIKINFKETIDFSFVFKLPKVEKNDLYNDNKNIIINNIDKILQKLSIEKEINLFIKNENRELNKNIELKKRILILEENQKNLKNIFEEIEKDKEKKIKILEEQLNKIREKLKNQENNSQLFENLKFGLYGKTESIPPFNFFNKDRNNILDRLNKSEENNKKNSEEYKNLIFESKNEDFKGEINNINNNKRKRSGFFKNIHDELKNKFQKSTKKNQNKESDEENNYLYSISENEIVDDIQFFDGQNSKQKLIEKKEEITPNKIENNIKNNILLGNKRNDNSQDNNLINLSSSKKVEEFTKEEINLESKILPLFEDYDFIINYLRNNLNLNVKKSIKIYRASEDGDQAQNFHSLCDNNTNIIVLIKTKDKKIFGGFTSKGFDISNTNIIDNSAFVFSLNNKQIYHVKKDKNAISCYENCGPCFTQILYIPDKFFINSSYTFIKNLNYLTTEDYQINGGNKFFEIEEIEVIELLIHD